MIEPTAPTAQSGSGQGAARRIRRIVVAFDGATDENLAAVETGAAFAARLRADLLGLFIEDSDLAKLAEYPGVATFGALSAGRPPLGAAHLKAALRAQLARTRHAVERAAERRHIRSSFEIRRGRVIAEIVGAASPADLVIIGWRGGAPTSVAAPGTPAVALLAALFEATVRCVLIPRREEASAGPVVVGYDASAAAREGLAAAAEIAGSGEPGVTIEIALLTGRLDQAEAWRREASIIAAPSGIRGVVFVQLPNAELMELMAMAGRERASLLVVPTHLLDPATTRLAIERAPCSLLLVR